MCVQAVDKDIFSLTWLVEFIDRTVDKEHVRMWGLYLSYSWRVG